MVLKVMCTNERLIGGDRCVLSWLNSCCGVLLDFPYFCFDLCSAFHTLSFFLYIISITYYIFAA